MKYIVIKSKYWIIGTDFIRNLTKTINRQEILKCLSKKNNIYSIKYAIMDKSFQLQHWIHPSKVQFTR